MRYKDFHTARYKPDGLAVFASFFVIDKKPNIKLDPIVKAISEVSTVGSTTAVEGDVLLSDILSDDLKVSKKYNPPKS